jgi:hypothetical protein
MVFGLDGRRTKWVFREILQVPGWQVNQAALTGIGYGGKQVACRVWIRIQSKIF